jgi:hypothetical protein
MQPSARGPRLSPHEPPLRAKQSPALRVRGSARLPSCIGIPRGGGVRVLNASRRGSVRRRRHQIGFDPPRGPGIAHKCAFGEISLTVTQLRAIEILLRKCIPDLAAAEIKSEQTHRYVIEIPGVLSNEQWLQKYGDGHATRS